MHDTLNVSSTEKLSFETLFRIFARYFFDAASSKSPAAKTRVAKTSCGQPRVVFGQNSTTNTGGVIWIHSLYTPLRSHMQQVGFRGTSGRYHPFLSFLRQGEARATCSGWPRTASPYLPVLPCDLQYLPPFFAAFSPLTLVSDCLRSTLPGTIAITSTDGDLAGNHDQATELTAKTSTVRTDAVDLASSSPPPIPSQPSRAETSSAGMGALIPDSAQAHLRPQQHWNFRQELAPTVISPPIPSQPSRAEHSSARMGALIPDSAQAYLQPQQYRRFRQELAPTVTSSAPGAGSHYDQRQHQQTLPFASRPFVPCAGSVSPPADRAGTVAWPPIGTPLQPLSFPRVQQAPSGFMAHQYTDLVNHPRTSMLSQLGGELWLPRPGMKSEQVRLPRPGRVPADLVLPPPYSQQEAPLSPAMQPHEPRLAGCDQDAAPATAPSRARSAWRGGRLGGVARSHAFDALGLIGEKHGAPESGEGDGGEGKAGAGSGNGGLR